MQYLAYILFRMVVALFRVMPFWLVYALSDGLCVLFYYVIPYRYKVLYTNLRNSFPGKSEAEVKQLVRASYRHIGDILFETIKGVTLSEREMRKRFVFKNPEQVNATFAKGQSVLLAGSHYANWEWLVTSFGLYLDHTIVGVYKPLANPYIERYMATRRTRYGMELCPIEQTKARFQQVSEKPDAFIMLTDQSPSNTARAHWFPFLNQDTPWLHGTDVYARKSNLPIYFVDNQCVRRGYYEVELSLLSAQPADLPDGAISQMVAAKLEQIIIAEPRHWLWSHKRWKHKRS